MSCRHCEAIRRAAATAWRRLGGGKHCVVRGCLGAHPICKTHWSMLSLPLRRRWWDECGYSSEPPKPDLINAINEALRKRER
jgi:hypothetical protein